MFRISIEIICFIMDIVIWILFLNLILTTRKKTISSFFFVGGFVLMELLASIPSLYFFTVYTPVKIITLQAITLLSTFILTYYYDAPFRHRLFATAGFDVCCAVGEYISGNALTFFSVSYLHLSMEHLDLLIQLISKLLQLALICILNIFWKRKQNQHSLKYSVTILLTPITSIVIFYNLPFPTSDEIFQQIINIISIAGLFVINVINYISLDNIFHIKDLEEQKKQLEQQLLFQTNKYSQISAAYRSTRSIIHETKRHFFYLQECAENNDVQHIIPYMKKAMQDMESCYNRINTGNLVIDSFVSNHIAMAEQENIQYSTDIRIDVNKVPVDDYDLSVILGNLLDNSLQECRNIKPPHPRSISVQILTTEKNFVIQIVNTCRNLQEKDMRNDSEYTLFHGYGIENVKKITRQYLGTYDIQQKNNLFDALIVIPILKCHPK